MLTILFSSFNGSKTLPRMLKAFLNLQEPTNGWKIIAVDNGSTDDTYEILKSYLQYLPLTIIQHAERGKNKALNRGLKHIEGELVVLTDDDIIPNEDWLLKLQEAANSQPNYDIFGGTILPQWPSPPPSWLIKHAPLGMAYSLTSQDLKGEKIAPGSVWGPNMMIRSKIFLSGIRFDENVGPAAGAYIMGSETELTTRLATHGHNCFFIPEAIVRHIIRPNQIKKSWILKRGFRAGRGIQRSQRSGCKPTVPQRVLGLESWQIRQLLESTLMSFILKITNQNIKAFPFEYNVYYLAGSIYQHFMPDNSTTMD